MTTYAEDGQAVLKRAFRVSVVWAWAASMLWLSSVALCGAKDPGAPGDRSQPLDPAASARAMVEEKFGIRVTNIQLSAGGYMVDFRYRVVDAEKAAELTAREVKPFLIDQASGGVLLVPRTPKLGALRQTGQKPTAGRVSFVLFSNPGKLVKSGSKVTVVIGNLRLEDLLVE